MLYDISPPITPALAVWPGDLPPSRVVSLDIARGDTITLSSLHATVHLGAHADAPSHHGAGAPGIEARPLDDYLGPCQLVDARVARGARVRLEDLAEPVDAPRVLIRTSTYSDPNRFTTDFAALDPELVRELARRGIRLIGIDTPSVDLFDSKDLPSHRAFLETDMAILEGLALAGAPAGRHELIALPLRLVGFDASPVRAVLRST